MGDMRLSNAAPAMTMPPSTARMTVAVDPAPQAKMTLCQAMPAGSAKRSDASPDGNGKARGERQATDKEGSHAGDEAEQNPEQLSGVAPRRP